MSSDSENNDEISEDYVILQLSFRIVKLRKTSILFNMKNNFVNKKNKKSINK